MGSYARSRPDPLDRRISARSQTDLKAVVRLEGIEVPCAIRDRSPGGARIVMAVDHPLPVTFELAELKSGRVRTAELIWVDKRQAGVRLNAPPPDCPLAASRRLRHGRKGARGGGMKRHGRLYGAIAAAALGAGISASALAQEAPGAGPKADAKAADASQTAAVPETQAKGGGEAPARLEPVTSSFDFVRREVMIPMRDGVKLHTVILVPRSATAAHRAGIVLTRTPYNADELTGHAQSGSLRAVLEGYDNAADVIVDGGYVRVVQDVRGKYGSEGDYVMNRPLAGTPLNPTQVDHATDTYDTIDWLVKNVPESNGKVAIIGISYDGFLPLMALINPHPALKASVPMNPMVDGWMGDDWFHKGAFREQNMPYIYEQDGTRSNSEKWWSSVHDDYEQYMRAGSADALAKTHGLDQAGFWRKVEAHPNYDAFWQAQAMDKILAGQPLKTPVLLVHSLWDAEDIYGAIAVYKAIKPKDVAGDMVYLAMGPWHHGQAIEDGSSMGEISFDGDTARWFRLHVLAPFLAHYLKDDAPPLKIAPVTAYETGAERWEKLASWPILTSSSSISM